VVPRPAVAPPPVAPPPVPFSLVQKSVEYSFSSGKQYFAGIGAKSRREPAPSSGDKDEDLAPDGREPGSAAKESTNPFDSSSNGGDEANKQVKDLANAFTDMLRKIDERGGGPNRSWDLCVEGGIREMTKREKKRQDKNGGYSKKIQLEVRLEKRGPVMNNDGTESTLKVIPSKYIIKRQELRNLIEMRKRYVLYFRLVKDSYGKASVIDLKRVDDNFDPKSIVLDDDNPDDEPDGPDEQLKRSLDGFLGFDEQLDEDPNEAESD